MTNDQLVFESRRLRCEGCQQPSRISPREGWQPSQRLFKHVAKVGFLSPSVHGRFDVLQLFNRVHAQRFDWLEHW